MNIKKLILEKISKNNKFFDRYYKILFYRMKNKNNLSRIIKLERIK